MINTLARPNAPLEATISAGRVLTINGGSSSIKFAIFELAELPLRILAGTIQRVGLADSFLRVRVGNSPNIQQPIQAANFDQAITVLLDWLDGIGELERVSAIGHRIVHGGPKHTEPQIVSPESLADLRQAIPFAPTHLPNSIQQIEGVAQRLPRVPQVVCFDTAFHRDLPVVARTLPIPRRYQAQGIRRYGFHGLSFAYLLEELARQAGTEAAQGRVILAHLGSGASLAAVRDGQCIDTTMGLTPAGGLVMGTRTGDIDPGVLVYLAKTEALSADQLEDLVIHQAGLLGVSESSSDVRDLLAHQATDPRAAEAIDLFCYQARKSIGALTAALGGLDKLVFSGGIGENASEIRTRICAGLGYLGIEIDVAANTNNAPLISTLAGTVDVRVIPTDEEWVIAKSVWSVTNATPSGEYS